LGGYWATVVVPGEATGGRVSLVDLVVEPQGYVVPHAHAREDEIVRVLGGRIGVRIGEEQGWAERGDQLVAPPEVPHMFFNIEPEPARLLAIFAPAGFERFFPAAAPLVAGPDPPDLEGLMALAAGFGISAEWPDWLEQARAAHPGLRRG
jgi:mannose-6-phosphate isomerase-like protein (cupin superfamily)